MTKYLVFGGIVGFLNGLLGGGGGAILVPLLLFFGKIPQNKALATSLAVLLPLSTVSVMLYYVQGNLDIKTAMPYVLGGGLGGIIGGKIFPKVKQKSLKWGFSFIIFLAGLRCFL